jgi:Mce-associated membrane protein
MTPTWYDILGVEPGATPEQIKAAWRDATDKFEPGTGGSQFRMFNEAADVLLDPEKRTAYDAELGIAAAVEAAPDVEPVVAEPRGSEETGSRTPDAEAATPAVETADAEIPDAEAPVKPARRIPGAAVFTSTLSLAILAVLALSAVILAVVLGVNLGNRVDDAKANPNSYAPAIGSEASAVAARATAAIQSYDYRSMDASRAQALKFLTPAYQKTYEKNFDGLLNGAAGFPGVVSTKTVVGADVLSTAVVDATPRTVRVLVFVNQETSAGGKASKVINNRVVVTMVRQGGDWLVNKLDPLVASF